MNGDMFRFKTPLEILIILVMANSIYFTIHIISYERSISLLEYIGTALSGTLLFGPSRIYMCSINLCQYDVLTLTIIAPIIGIFSALLWSVVRKVEIINFITKKNNMNIIIENGFFRIQFILLLVVIMINIFLGMNAFGIYKNISQFLNTKLLIQNLIIMNLVFISLLLNVSSQILRTRLHNNSK